MDPLFLTFDDDGVEAAFRTLYDQRAVRAARLGIPAGAPGYLLMCVILDDPEARAIAILMTALVAGWIAFAWSPLYARAFTPITMVAVSVLTALSWVMFLALPPVVAIIVAIAYITLNFIWVFVFLRIRFLDALVFGLAYLATIVVAGAVVWERAWNGGRPAGLISPLGGAAGGSALVFLYAGFLLVLSAAISHRLERNDRTDYLLRRELALAHEESERLLQNVLPAPIAERLKSGENPIADELPEVSVVFADIVGFTELAAGMAAATLVSTLDDVFREFDRLADRHGLEKIKTIGDAYMAVAGAPDPRPDHAEAAADMALEMLEVLRRVEVEGRRPLSARIGIASGAVVAGIIGTHKFAYDMWGDTVNTASRMEAHGLVDRIQITDATRRRLGDAYAVEDRGVVDIKGKGPLHTWLLSGRAPTSSPSLPAVPTDVAARGPDS
jgi:class 3 adenylate cyclase